MAFSNIVKDTDAAQQQGKADSKHATDPKAVGTKGAVKAAVEDIKGQGQQGQNQPSEAQDAALKGDEGWRQGDKEGVYHVQGGGDKTGEVYSEDKKDGSTRV